MMKLLARCTFLLVTVLWGSFYAVAKGALAHSDPIIFTFFEALTLVPLALILLFMHRKRLTLAIVKRGVLLGSGLCIATLTITVSENFTSATTTVFFPSTGGIFAAVIMATVFRRSLAKAVWIAGGLSGIGILLMFGVLSAQRNCAERSLLYLEHSSSPSTSSWLSKMLSTRINHFGHS